MLKSYNVGLSVGGNCFLVWSSPSCTTPATFLFINNVNVASLQALTTIKEPNRSKGKLPKRYVLFSVWELVYGDDDDDEKKPTAYAQKCNDTIHQSPTPTSLIDYDEQDRLMGSLLGLITTWYVNCRHSHWPLVVGIDCRTCLCVSERKHRLFTRSCWDVKDLIIVRNAKRETPLSPPRLFLGNPSPLQDCKSQLSRLLRLSFKALNNKCHCKITGKVR